MKFTCRFRLKEFFNGTYIEEGYHFADEFSVETLALCFYGPEKPDKLTSFQQGMHINLMERKNGFRLHSATSEIYRRRQE